MSISEAIIGKGGGVSYSLALISQTGEKVFLPDAHRLEGQEGYNHKKVRQTFRREKIRNGCYGVACWYATDH